MLNLKMNTQVVGGALASRVLCSPCCSSGRSESISIFSSLNERQITAHVQSTLNFNKSSHEYGWNGGCSSQCRTPKLCPLQPPRTLSVKKLLIATYARKRRWENKQNRFRFVTSVLVTSTPSHGAEDFDESMAAVDVSCWQTKLENEIGKLEQQVSEPDLDLPHISEEAPSLNLQVQTPRERELLASTPAHPKALNALYGTYLTSCFMEHTWKFACPALLSILHHSLLPVAVASFTGQLIIFVASPWLGELMDRAPRVLAFNCLVTVQMGAMLVSAAMVAVAVKSGVTQGVSAAAMFSQPWFLVLVLVSAVERITGLASGVAIERDWVVKLAGHNRPIALAKANATLRRVDLFCEIAGPMVFGWMLSTQDTMLCLNWSAMAIAATIPVVYAFVKMTNTLSSGVLERRKPIFVSELPEVDGASNTQSSDKNGRSSTESSCSSVATKSDFFRVLKEGWKQYLAQPVLPASLAYVLLYFNAVLSPGGLMTSFLTQRGLDVSVIGAFRGACAATGFLATFISAPLISRIGVLKAGAAALLMQSAALVTSVLIYLFTPIGNREMLLVFLGLVIVSRLGHWTYDCIDAQIFQTAIPPNQANVVGSTEVSLASLAELVMLAMAIVANDVSHFGALAFVSMSSVLCATAIYCRWLANPTADQRRLFPDEPHFKLDIETTKYIEKVR